LTAISERVLELRADATYHKVQSFASDTFPCHDRFGCGRVNKTLAYILQESHIAPDAHGIRGASVDLGLIVLDSERTRHGVSGWKGRNLVE
jgi:hypothetical protein